MSHMPTEADWRELFRHAIRDWNSKTKAVCLEEACEAIQRRLRGDAHSVPLERGERRELESALYFLSLLGMAR
jgi:hypothetical protein